MSPGFSGPGKKVRYTLAYRVIYVAGGTVKVALKDFLFVLCIDVEHEITFADRAAEDIRERTFHAYSFLISMIWVSWGPWR